MKYNRDYADRFLKGNKSRKMRDSLGFTLHLLYCCIPAALGQLNDGDVPEGGVSITLTYLHSVCDASAFPLSYHGDAPSLKGKNVLMT